MSADVFFCQAHQANATEFCLCDQVPVYLCASCLPKHKDKSSHDVFPMANLGLYRALGNDKAELVRRTEIVKKCSDFLDNASAREAAVLTEANSMMTDLVRCYQGLLEKSHRCFTNLVEVLREEVAVLLTTSEMMLSPLSQILVDRSHSLNAKEENLLCTIPEEELLKEIMQRGNQVLAKAQKAQQQEYENEVQQAFMNLSRKVQQIPAAGALASVQRTKTLAAGVQVQDQRMNAPVKRIQVSDQRAKARAQGDVQKLIAVLKDEVKWFDVATSQWQQLLALRQNIQVDRDTSSTFIPPNRIFVCGGGSSVKSACTRHVGSSAYMLEGDGSVTELPRMSTVRWGPGVAWDSVRQALYVFGGSDDGRGTCYTERLRASEMFLSEWSPLPDMHQGRKWFNPCWHSSIVYLCGGYDNNSVETYDPRSNTFVLQDFILPESKSYQTAVVENETLTVISKNYISKLQQGRLTSQNHERYFPWSSCTPLVSGGVVYVYYDDICRCIDLTTGAMQKGVSLS